MTETTISAIETMAKADPESTPEQVRAIVRACKMQGVGKCKMILAKEAMQILDISRPTLRRLTRSGKLHEVKATPRKTRFFLDEVEALATSPEVF